MTAVNELLDYMLSENGERLDTRICVKLQGDYHITIELAELGKLSNLLRNVGPSQRAEGVTNSIVEYFKGVGECTLIQPNEVFIRMSLTVQDRELSMVYEKHRRGEPNIHIRNVFQRSGLEQIDHITLLWILDRMLPEKNMVKYLFNSNFRFETTFTETTIKPLGSAGYQL